MLAHPDCSKALLPTVSKTSKVRNGKAFCCDSADEVITRLTPRTACRRALQWKFAASSTVRVSAKYCRERNDKGAVRDLIWNSI